MTDHGIEGNANQGGARQVTLIERARWRRVVEQLGDAADPALRRANLLVDLDLVESRGRTLAIGDCHILIRGQTHPCRRMEESLPGLQEALRADWGGGAYGEVVRGGTVSVGDPVQWLAPDA